jgi:ligand-binding sensor domain-containing protein
VNPAGETALTMATASTGHPNQYLTQACLQLALWILFNPSFGQENSYIKSFSTSDGLAHDRIRAITQDHCGFIWLGTWDGLSRFDGYEFRNYRHRPGDDSTIPYFALRKVLVDGGNRVWVYSDLYMLAVYNRTRDSFETPTGFPDSLDARRGVSDISLDREKNLWIVRSEGLWKCDAKTGSWSFHPVFDQTGQPFRFFVPQYITLFFGPDNEIWFRHLQVYRAEMRCGEKGQGGGFYIRDIYGYEERAFIHFTFDYTETHQLYRSPSGKVWMPSNRGVQLLDPAEGRFRLYSGPIPPGELPDDRQVWWSDYLQDLYFHRPGEPLIRIPAQISQVSTFAFSDRQNSLWFGNIGETGNGIGLHLHYQIPPFFQHYLTEFHDDYRQVSIRAVLKDRRGDIWVSTSGYSQVFRIDTTLRVQSLQPLPPELRIRNNMVKSMLEVDTGIWMGYLRQQLVHYHTSEDRFQIAVPKLSDESQMEIPYGYHNLLPGPEGGLLVNANPIFRYHSSGNKFEALTEMYRIPNYGDMAFYFMEQDSLNRYWVGTGNSQLLRFTPGFELDTIFTLSSDLYNLEGLLFGKNGELWITSLGSGLIRFEPESGSIRYFTTADGLSHNTTYSILRDATGYFWISTNEGLSRFDPKTEQFRIFGIPDGLHIREFNSDAHFQTPDGQMFFGGMGGLVSFFPDSIDHYTSGRQEVPFIISDFRVSNIARHFDTPIRNDDRLRLQKGDNNFQITMARLDYRDSDKIRYRYRMRGYQDEWLEADHLHRTINFTNLRPQKMLLELEAADRDGQWVSQLHLHIEIPPFFYQTTWFTISIVLLVLVTGGAILYLYSRQLLLREKQKQEELRMESLKGQMNPHFIFNSLNSINYFISQNDRLAANRYIADFSRLVRAILDNISEEYITLEKEIESLQDYLYLEHLRFGDRFDYRIQYDTVEDPLGLEVFPGLIQPFVENAIWHGIRPLQDRKGMLILEFRQKAGNDHLCCTVQDDGAGRRKASANGNAHPGQRSRGIRIATQRLDAYNRLYHTDYKIKIEDLHPGLEECGTRVQIDIPVRPVGALSPVDR